MSDDTDVEQLLENVQNALDALNKIEDVEGLINKLDTRNNRKLLKKVKTVVSDVHSKVNTIKEKVSKAYKKVKIRSNSETDDSVVNDKDGSDKETALGATQEENVVRDPEKSSENDTAGRHSPIAKEDDRITRRCLRKRKNDAPEEENATEDIDTETNKEQDVNSEVDNNEVETESNLSSSQDIVEATPEKQLKKIVLTLKKNQTSNDESVVEITDCSVGNVPEQDNETRSEEDKEKSDDQNNKNSNDETETEKAKSDEDPEIRVPKIKLVDINKLLDPNAKPLETTPLRKSRKSVTFDSSVIVLTSSDDDTPKKTPKEKDPSPLKSALRKASPKSIEMSDSDSKENNENLRNTATKKKSTVEQSSDDSDLDGNKGGSRRLRRHDKTIKERFSVLVKERKLRNYSKKSEGKESQKHNPKSKNKKLQSDSEDEDKDNRKLNNKKRRKKDILQESSLSEGSDNSDESDSEKLPASFKGGSKRRKKANRAEPDANDPKFKAEVRINLPRFECEKLPELYKRKKEIFEIKKLSKINLSRRARREKSENKKTKLTLRDKGKSTGDSSDDEERSSTEENEDAAKSDEGLHVAPQSADSMDNLAMSCLEQLNDESSDGEAKKSKKTEVERASEEDNTLEKDKEPLLNGKLSDGDDGVENKRKETNGDSGEEELNNKKRKKKQDASDSNEEEPNNRKGKKKKKDASDSSEDESNNKKGRKKKDASDSSEEESNNKKGKKKKDASDSSEEESNNKKGKKKKKEASDSSEEESNNKKGKKKKKDASDSSEEEANNKKGKKKKDASENSSDSDEDFGKFSRKKDKSKKDLAKEAKKRMKKKLISDSEESDKDNVKKKNDASDEDSDSSSHSGGDSREEKDKEEKSKPARRRIQRVKDSSSDDEEESTRKKIRKMIDRDSLSESTKKAEQDERDRKARIAEKQQKYNKIFELKADATVDKVVLDFDDKTDKPLLSVHKKLVKQLKPHQVSGIKFMWDACFESLDRAKKTGGSGCILAHCMGLGKTLQVVALAHTLLTHSEKTGVEKILVVCPVNTVLNWKNEFNKWLPNTDDFEVFELVSCKETNVNSARRWVVKNWSENGGVLIIGYNMFRTLSNPQNKALAKSFKQVFQAGLVNPGPDLVVCDEGHLLKNEKTNLSIAMNRIKTARRIVLTGTPLQNNLREYWCMVQFIKPNLLGTYKEYLNRFVNPITNGQYTDSTQRDIMVMRRRSHVLHKLLDGVVQRQDYAVLEPYLPPKYEYVLFLQLTEVQIKLYQHYMDNFARRGDGSNRTSFLFTDFQELQRICTHPRVLLDKSIENKEKKLNDESDSEGSIKDFLDDESDTSSSSSDDENGSDSEISIRGSDSDASVRSVEKNKKKKKRGSAPRRGARLTRAAKAARTESDDDLVELDDEQIHQKEWFDEYISRDELDNINHSAKIFLLFQILKECEEIGDKVLVFSQSLYTLNCLEYFLGRIDEATQKGDTEKVGGHSGGWSLGLDYFRLDGSSSCDNRANWCDQFNDPENTRARLFLISTKAGGLGINLVAANRVIIFDVSWNPSHDIQSIYRVYRFGQTKPSYIYRFVTNGTMEMKIYERQVTKQAISKRVIDEQQIDRHYSQNDIQELYKTDVEPTERPVPMVPKDVLLGEMVQKYDKTIFKFHEHQSLLENKQDEELNEDERKAAWDEFENEKVLRKTNVTNFGGIQWGAIQNNTFNYSPQVIQLALGNMVRKDNPTWSDVQIKGILPALVAQLQVQMSAQDFSMYNRVQQEIRIMQALHAQRMHQFQLQQQMMKQAAGVDMMITPEQIRQIQMAQASQNYIQPAQGPSRSRDVIELND